MENVIYVETDTSAGGVAAVLSQRNNKIVFGPYRTFHHPLASRKRIIVRYNYKVKGIVSDARKWSVHLRTAAEVIFLTDYCPLQWLKFKRTQDILMQDR